jgi:hypothetical protein
MTEGAENDSSAAGEKEVILIRFKYYLSMTATTIKLEGDIFKEVKQLVREKQSITSFVRQSIQAELKRIRMREAAVQYQQFLQKNPEEAHDMALWEAADLAKAVD